MTGLIIGFAISLVFLAIFTVHRTLNSDPELGVVPVETPEIETDTIPSAQTDTL